MAIVNCLRCRFWHADNGNCTAVGGVCTAVPAAHCPLLREYLDTELTPQEVLSMKFEWCAMMDALNSIGGGYTRLRELAEADKDGRLAVHGRWISWEKAGNCVPSPDRHECSVCHDAAQVLVNGFELLSDYCPNCGAKMDGGDNTER